MSDVFTKRKRSEVMTRIRSRGNRDTELALASILRKEHIAGWRTQRALVFRVRGSEFRVRPDFIFPKQRVAVFVDGCFWHGCPKHSNPVRWLKKSSMEEKAGVGSQKSGVSRKAWRSSRLGGSSPLRTGKAFWWNKLVANQKRDRVVNATLRRTGWRVVRIWEHELARGRSQKSVVRSQKVVEKIRNALQRR